MIEHLFQLVLVQVMVIILIDVTQSLPGKILVQCFSSGLLHMCHSHTCKRTVKLEKLNQAVAKGMDSEQFECLQNPAGFNRITA